MDKLFELISKTPDVIHWYLTEMIFPEYMRNQVKKLSASGQAVGGDMLFGSRIGFSGTPSDLLPKELGQCGYETGSVCAAILRSALTDVAGSEDDHNSHGSQSGVL